jgi:DNA-binding HxlR family transcriptional regulator
MERDGLVTKTVFPSVPPHTEYKLSPDGMEFLELLDTVKDLAVRWKGTQLPV